jgi:hypothetical protein
MSFGISVSIGVSGLLAKWVLCYVTLLSLDGRCLIQEYGFVLFGAGAA